MDGQQLSYDRQYEMNARNVDGSAVAKSTDVRDWNVAGASGVLPVHRCMPSFLLLPSSFVSSSHHHYIIHILIY